jgi:hypothetical protein
MGIKLNLTNDEIKSAQGGFPVLPAGVYGANIYSSELKNSKAGNPMYVIDFKITEGQAGIGRKQRSWFVLSPNALFSVIGLNKAVGFPYPTKDTPAGEFEFNDADDYVGKKVNIVLEVEDYESVDEDDNDVVKQRNVVKRVNAYDTDKVTGAEVADAKSGLFL